MRLPSLLRGHVSPAFVFLLHPHVWMSTRSGSGVLYRDLASTLLAVEQEPARVAKEGQADPLERALRGSPEELKLALSLASFS